MPKNKKKQARDWAFPNIKGLEKEKLKMVNDQFNVPTIGVGYAAIVNGRGGRWFVKETIENDFEAIGAKYSAITRRTLERIAQEKNKNKTDKAKIRHMIDSLANVNITEKQSQSLFNISFDRHYEETQRILGREEFDLLGYERQGTLTMGTFQSPVAMRRERDAIRAGILEDKPDKVVEALDRIGEHLNDSGRYHAISSRYVDPDMKGKIEIKSGDTLGNIAERHGTTVDALMEANPHLKNPDKIRSSDVLTLPEDTTINLTVPDKPYTGVPITIEGVPEGAHLTAGTSLATPQLERIKEKQSKLGMTTDAIAAAWEAQQTKQASAMPAQKINDAPDFFDQLEQGFNALLDAIGESIGGVGSALIGNANASDMVSNNTFRSTPRSPLRSLKGVGANDNIYRDAIAQLLDRDAINSLMKTPAYQKQSHPLRTPVTGAVKSFFKNTYPGPATVDATGKIAATGPRLKASWDKPIQSWSELEQKRQKEIKKEIKNQTPSSSSSPLQAQQTNKPTTKPTLGQSIAPQYIFDKLKPGIPHMPLRRPARRSLLESVLTNAAKPQKPMDNMTVAILIREAKKIAEQKHAKGALSKQNKSLLKTVEALGNASSGAGRIDRDGKFISYLGNPGRITSDGKYISGTNSRGKSTGGVRLDKHGREVGAWGQFTRDIVGRKNSDGSSSSSNTRVICTELVRQGLMQPELQRLDARFTFARLSPFTVKGYHLWAVPYVRLMKRSKLATNIIEPIARCRAEEIVFQMGARPSPNWRGKLVRLVMEPVCWVLGWVYEKTVRLGVSA